MKIPHMRWVIAGLLLLATVINYLDRNCLAYTAPILKKVLAIDEQKFSYIVSAFLITYGVMQPLAGRFMDWVGTRKGFTVAVVWWSLANMLHGLATGWRSFAFFRILLGVGEAGNFPGAAKTIAEWFPAKERSIATGVFNVGSSVGAMLAPPLIAFITLTWGWQAAFISTGAVGFFWVALWLVVYQPLHKNRWVTDRERAHIQENAAVEPAAPAGESTWGAVLSSRNFWGIAVARFFAEPAWQFVNFWIPLFFVAKYGLNLKEIAAFAWLPFLVAEAGCLAGGFFSPILMRFNLGLLTARKAAAAVSAVMMVTMVLAGWASTPHLAILIFCVAAFAHQSLSSTVLTLPADLFPKDRVGTANGLTGLFGYIGATLMTLAIGWVVKNHGWTPWLFWALGIFDLIGVGLLWILIKGRAEPAGKPLTT